MDMAEASPTPREEPMNEDLSPDAASLPTVTPCCTVGKEVGVVSLLSHVRPLRPHGP